MRTWILIGAIVLVLAGAMVSGASALSWLCPDCLDNFVERAPEATTLECPKCGAVYETDDLSLVVAYINYRTRDAEVAWIVLPELDCQIFRTDGLQAFNEDGDEVWIPWISIDYYIPRMRLLRLADGRELATDYPKGPTCPTPPMLIFEIADSINVPGTTPSQLIREVESDLAELLLIAPSPEARDSARVRFINEVEAGNHPRLPRTPARVRRVQQTRTPSTVAKDVLPTEVILEARVSERGRLLRIRTIESSGNAEIDGAAIAAARRSTYQCGGEMGVPVPSSVRLHYYFDDAQVRIESEPAIPGVWDE